MAGANGFNEYPNGECKTSRRSSAKPSGDNATVPGKDTKTQVMELFLLLLAGIPKPEDDKSPLAGFVTVAN